MKAFAVTPVTVREEARPPVKLRFTGPMSASISASALRLVGSQTTGNTPSAARVPYPTEKLIRRLQAARAERTVSAGHPSQELGL
jgi:hypothetical protein